MEYPQLAWYIGGPILGLCVVAMRWLLNERLGLTGAWSAVIERATERSPRLGTRGWLLIGLVVGAVGFSLIEGGPSFHGYGWMTDTFSGTSGTIVIGAILVACGVLIGFGAKTAGGCTSGNGLSGNAQLSPASLVATGTFFATAIVVSFVIEWLI
ncbi:MAG: YeeE/YedE family protein [Actinomycetota bacterium]|nr:YeeE/YedE family protein [Actinomycetota bacterium]